MANESNIKIVLKNEINEIKSIFDSVYQKSDRVLDNIIKSKFEDDKSYIGNNIIAFCGDRGKGKTTAMNEYAEKLKIENDKYKVLDTIDPSMFSGNDSLFEIIIARLFEEFEVEKINDTYKQRKILKLFEEVYSQLKTIYESKESRFSKDFYEEENIETITRLKNSLEIRATFSKIVDEYLDDDKKHLVIKIDDLDMDLNYAFNIIEEIRRYFIVNNVIVLIACNDVQLNSLLSENFKKFLYKNGELLARNYITKLFPVQNRVYLPELDNLIINDEIIFEVDGKRESESVVDSILKDIYCKTRLIFLKNKYDFNTLIPTNLRDLVQLKSLLNNMEDVKNCQNDSALFSDLYNLELNNQLRNNLKIFREYLLFERIVKDSTVEEIEFLRNLPNVQAGKLNKEIFLYFSKIAGDDINKIVFVKNEDEEDYALSTAKILYIMNEVAANSKIIIDQFVYYVKCIYSTILLENTIFAISEKRTSNLLGNIGKNIIGSYKPTSLKNDYEYDLYPRIDLKKDLIKIRTLSTKDVKLTDENGNEIKYDLIFNTNNENLSNLKVNLEKMFLNNINNGFANILFATFLSIGKFDGKNMFNPLNNYVGSVGVQNAHFRLNNFIFHNLDFNRNFERLFGYFNDADIEEKVNQDIKEVLNKIKEMFFENVKNTILIFPIYSIDYIEKINEFEFSYKSSVTADNFYKLIYENFINKLIKCNNSIVKYNSFLAEANMVELLINLKNNFEAIESDTLSNNIKMFINNVDLNAKLIDEINQHIKWTLIPFKSTIIKEIKNGSIADFTETLVENFSELSEKLKKFDDKYKTIFDDIDNDLKIYKLLNEYSSDIKLGIQTYEECEKDIENLIDDRTFKNKRTLKSRFDELNN